MRSYFHPTDHTRFTLQRCIEEEAQAVKRATYLFSAACINLFFTWSGLASSPQSPLAQVVEWIGKKPLFSISALLVAFGLGHRWRARRLGLMKGHFSPSGRLEGLRVPRRGSLEDSSLNALIDSPPPSPHRSPPPSPAVRQLTDSICQMYAGSSPRSIKKLMDAAREQAADKDLATLTRFAEHQGLGEECDLSAFEDLFTHWSTLFGERRSYLGLKKLRVSSANLISDNLKKVFKACPNLTVLELDGCTLLDDGAVIGIAQSYPELEAIDLSGCRSITAQSIRALAEGCPKLRMLNVLGCTGINGWPVFAEDTVPLACLEKIKVGAIDAALFRWMARLPHLSEIRIQGPLTPCLQSFRTFITESQTGGLRDVRLFNVSGPDVKQIIGDLFRKHPHLEHLTANLGEVDFNEKPFHGETFPFLKELKDLSQNPSKKFNPADRYQRAPFPNLESIGS